MISVLSLQRPRRLREQKKTKNKSKTYNPLFLLSEKKTQDKHTWDRAIRTGSLTLAHLILSLTPSSVGAMNGGMPARSMYAMTPMLQQSQAWVRAFSASCHARTFARSTHVSLHTAVHDFSSCPSWATVCGFGDACSAPTHAVRREDMYRARRHMTNQSLQKNASSPWVGGNTRNHQSPTQSRTYIHIYIHTPNKQKAHDNMHTTTCTRQHSFLFRRICSSTPRGLAGCEG